MCQLTVDGLSAVLLACAGRVRLDILLSSDVFRELLTLMKDVEDGVHGLNERNGQRCKNWFCEETQSALYEIYNDLDVNMDGLLSDSEMLAYGTSCSKMDDRRLLYHLR